MFDPRSIFTSPPKFGYKFGYETSAFHLDHRPALADLNCLFAFNAAFDAVTGARLWSSGSRIGGSIYGAPMVVNGKVFVGAWDNKLYAFGL